MPDDFRNALIVSLYKKKGSKSDSQLQERSLRESSLIDSSQSLHRPSRRHSAASGRAGAL